MKKIYVADKETGNFIEEVETYQEGLELIAEYEAADKKDGTYEENFYDIVDEEHCTVVFKYAIIDMRETQSDEDIFDSKEAAIREADYRWSHLTSAEKQKRTVFEVMYGRVGDLGFDLDTADSIKDYLQQSLAVDTYSSNCIVYSECEDKRHTVYYDADTLDNYSPEPAISPVDDPFESREEAVEQYRLELIEELENEFTMAVNIEDIVDTIMIYASATISAMWAEEEK